MSASDLMAAAQARVRGLPAEAPVDAPAEPLSDEHPTQGFVYLIQEQGGGAVKVGFSTDPEKRLAALQTASPSALDLLDAFAGTPADERRLHATLRPLRRHGEWFDPSAVEFVRSYFAQPHTSS